MTQEQKAKRYDEALERAKSMIDDLRKGEDILAVSDLEEMFPELKESEDERIRKVLIHIVKGACNKYDMTYYYQGVEVGEEKLLAWLEKQGQVKESSISQHENKTCKENSNSLTGKDEQILANSAKTCKDEQKPAIDFRAEDWCVSKVDGKIHNIYNSEVGPKFKVGDWITNGEYTWKVTDIKSLDYILQSQDGNIVDDTISFVDYNYFRLWSINDAKPGDVLVDIYNNIGIFQKCEGIYWQSYLYLGCNGELLGFSDGGYHKQTNTHPATKEQRDALEKAMADAGYISDSDKKELKKIEQKPAWSEEDKKMLGKVLKCIRFVEDSYPLEKEVDGVSVKMWLLDHIKPQPKQEWSEEDEMITLSIEQVINCASLLNIVPEKIDKIKSWLKSLKERVM